MVEVLRAAGVETFESCEGGAGHSYPEPTVPHWEMVFVSKAPFDLALNGGNQTLTF